MTQTNPLTARAATQTVTAPIRPMRLLGVFTGGINPYVLLQTPLGEVIRLSRFIPTAGLRLVRTGDGWAMIDDGTTLHRLVIG